MIRTASLLALSFAFAACGTIYTRTFSPRLSYYEKPAAKVEENADELLQANAPEAPPQGGTTAPAVPPPPAPAPDAAPAIPGLPQ